MISLAGLSRNSFRALRGSRESYPCPTAVRTQPCAMHRAPPSMLSDSGLRHSKIWCRRPVQDRAQAFLHDRLVENPRNHLGDRAIASVGCFLHVCFGTRQQRACTYRVGRQLPARSLSKFSNQQRKPSQETDSTPYCARPAIMARYSRPEAIPVYYSATGNGLSAFQAVRE